MADFVSLECVQQLDLAATYTNALIASVPDAARIPVVASSDRDILDIAILACEKNHWDEMKIIHIKNIPKLEYIEISANMFSACDSISDRITIYSTPFDLEFDCAGRIKRIAVD